MRIIAIFVFIAFTLSSCNEIQNVKVEQPTIIKNKSFITPRFDFKAFSTYSGDSTTYCTYFSESKKLFIGFDLNRKKSLLSFRLPKALCREEDNGYLSSYFIQNFDSIFILQNFRLSIIDTAGHVKYTRVINHPESESLPDTLHGNFGGGFPVYYASENKELFLMQYSGKYNFHEKNFFKLP